MEDYYTGPIFYLIPNSHRSQRPQPFKTVTKVPSTHEFIFEISWQSLKNFMTFKELMNIKVVPDSRVMGLENESLYMDLKWMHFKFKWTLYKWNLILPKDFSYCYVWSFWNDLGFPNVLRFIHFIASKMFSKWKFQHSFLKWRIRKRIATTQLTHSTSQKFLNEHISF